MIVSTIIYVVLIIGFFAPVIPYKIYQHRFQKRFVHYLADRDPDQLRKLDLPEFTNLDIGKEISGFKFYINIYLNPKALPHDPFLDFLYRKMRVATILILFHIIIYFTFIIPLVVRTQS